MLEKFFKKRSIVLNYYSMRSHALVFALVPVFLFLFGLQAKSEPGKIDLKPKDFKWAKPVQSLPAPLPTDQSQLKCDLLSGTDPQGKSCVQIRGKTTDDVERAVKDSRWLGVHEPPGR